MPLALPQPTLADYRLHLLQLRHWLTPLLAWLAAYGDGPQGEPALPAIDRLCALQADLDDRALPACNDELTPPAWPWPAGANAAYRWGVCYVIEGSQLGGAVLYKKLAASLAPHPLRYLQGTSDGLAAPRWLRFIGAMRQQVVSAADIENAARGAADAFDALLAIHAETQA
ncbi:MAG TPA: biliverdin-producing heme oxygenase [Burkholderiaceae bacterium]